VKIIRKYVDKVNKLKPDIVFFTGDLVTSGTKYIERGAQELGRLKSKYGTYACLGDHDNWASASQVVQSLNSNGVRTFDDQNHYVALGRDSILVTFITNIYSRRPGVSQLHTLFGQQPRGVLDIVVTHQPSEELVELAAEKGYNLFLAGHTHGGQIVFRPFGYLVTPPRLESPFFRGTQFVERMFVSINNGLGLTLAPLRFNAPAEITLIRIGRTPS
jgi:predicted MPP superfamily phosphohydrolase